MTIFCITGLRQIFLTEGPYSALYYSEYAPFYSLEEANVCMHIIM